MALRIVKNIKINSEMKNKTVIKNGVTYYLISEDQSIKFVCDICKKEKTSKKYVEYRDNGMHVCLFAMLVTYGKYVKRNCNLTI